MIKTFLVDMDDTILPSGHNYFIPELECAKIIAVELGHESPEPVTMIETADEIRKDLMYQDGPVSITVFPQSWILYYHDVCNTLNREPNGAIISALGMTAMLYFREKYELYPEAPEVLSTLRAAGKKLILVTLGNLDVQTYKISNSGVEQYVDAIEIVDVKRKETYGALLAKYGLNPAETAMVGDNDKLDIQPALDCGMMGFHRTHPFETYKIDVRQKGYIAIRSLKDLLNYIPVNVGAHE